MEPGKHRFACSVCRRKTIQAAIDYIEAHREEVEAEYQRIIDRHRNYKYTPEVQAKLDASHRKFVAFVQELRSQKSQKDSAVKLRILADHDVEGQVEAILRICTSPEWADVWASLACQVDSFERLRPPQNTIDSEVWQMCQDLGIVLITGNRNADGAASLEMTIRDHGTDKSLPVLTISDSKRLLKD